MKPIPLARPAFDEMEMRSLEEVIASGWVAQGPMVRSFEEQFSASQQAPHSVAVSSCTAALHLTLVALGVGAGDEVVVPAFTWVATANAVEYTKGRAVFADINPTTYNVDPAAIEAAITPRTVGILPVHQFGLCADMDPIMAIAARHGLWVVEDAACGFGATRQSDRAGSFGQAACFSFHPRKSVTTGEGGMVSTRDKDLALRISSLRNHGATAPGSREPADDDGMAEFNELGYNYRMTDMQGAVGIAQLSKADWILSERRRLAALYDKKLDAIQWLVRPASPEGYGHAYQSYVCRVDREGGEDGRRMRNLLLHHMAKSGVGGRPGTHAPPTLGYYRERYSIPRGSFPIAEQSQDLTIALPMYAGMSEVEVDLVVRALSQGGSTVDFTVPER